MLRFFSYSLPSIFFWISEKKEKCSFPPPSEHYISQAWNFFHRIEYIKYFEDFFGTVKYQVVLVFHYHDFILTFYSTHNQIWGCSLFLRWVWPLMFFPLMFCPMCQDAQGWNYRISLQVLLYGNYLELCKLISFCSTHQEVPWFFDI